MTERNVEALHSRPKNSNTASLNNRPPYFAKETHKLKLWFTEMHLESVLLMVYYKTVQYDDYQYGKLTTEAFAFAFGSTTLATKIAQSILSPPKMEL